MEIIDELRKIVEDYKSIDNPTDEQFNQLKDREFRVFEDITTIKELCEYYKTDLTLDDAPSDLISGIYSGAINGAMFVINKIKTILEQYQVNAFPSRDTIQLIGMKLDEIQGIDTEND